MLPGSVITTLWNSHSEGSLQLHRKFAEPMFWDQAILQEMSNFIESNPALFGQQLPAGTGREPELYKVTIPAEKPAPTGLPLDLPFLPLLLIAFLVLK